MAKVWHSRPNVGPVRGEYTPPGDLIITQQALVLSALAVGPSRLHGALESEATVATRRVLAHLGVTFTTGDDGGLIVSRRSGGLAQSEVELDCGFSFDTLALIAGLVAGQNIEVTITGDAGIKRQPIRELIEMLRALGAEIESLGTDHCPPLRIKGGGLQSATVELSTTSYRFKAALIVAAMQAEGLTRIRNCHGTHDHTERLLRQMGVSVRREGQDLLIKGLQHIHPRRIKVPPDMTVAAPFITAAVLIPDSELLLRQVGTNPGRNGFLKTMHRSGASIERIRDWQFGTEPVSSFLIKYTSDLKPFNVAPNLAISLEQEIPLLALAAARISGASSLRGAHLLDPHALEVLGAAADVLRAFGAEVEVTPRGFTIAGQAELTPGSIACQAGPMVVALAAVASLISGKAATIEDVTELERYYPGTLEDLEMLAY